MKATKTNIRHAVSSMSYNRHSIADLDNEANIDALSNTSRASYQQEVTKLVAKLSQFYGNTWASLTRSRPLHDWERRVIPAETVASVKITASLDNLGNYYVKNGNIFAFKESEPDT